MKNQVKILFSGLLITALFAGMTSALAVNIPAGTLREPENQNVIENTSIIFTDVIKDDSKNAGWAYDAIMAMTQQGLFSGTTTPVNGVGTFSPDKTMTRAEFVVVVVRALYKDELNAMPKSGGQWWSNARQIAIANGLLEDSELDNGNLSKPMTRQEMAMLLARAAEVKKDYPDELLDSSRIPDYSSIGGYYKDYVITAYSMGMLCGTDKSGTFSPGGTLSRAQAATVLYRLVEPSARQEVDFTAPVVPPVSGPITIYEGQRRHNRLAQVGDTVIKADGTKVVLALGKDGVLGQDQGVAPDLGYEMREDSNWGYIVENKVVFIGDGTNSLGQSVTNDDYKVNPYTGMGAWGLEWSKIAKAHPKPDVDGTKDEQLSADGYWVWVAVIDRWVLACN